MRRSTTTNRVFAARFTPPGGRNCVVVGRPGPYPPVPVFETSFDAPDLRVDPTPSVSTDWARADYHFEYRVESEDVRALPGSGCTSPSSCFEILDLIPDAPARITVTPTLSLEPAEYRFELSGNRYDLYRIESPVTVEPEIMVFGGGTATGAVSASGFVVDATMPEGGHAYIRMLTRATLVEEAHDGDVILTTTRTPFTFRGPYIELQGIHDP